LIIDNFFRYKVAKVQRDKGFLNPKKEFYLSISTKEKSPQVIPHQESNLCQASRGDFSFVEMTQILVIKDEILSLKTFVQKNFEIATLNL